VSLRNRPVGSDSALRTSAASLRGLGSYVPDPSVAAGKLLVAEVVDSSTVRVSVDRLSIEPVEWSELVLTYNPQGAPVTNLDGQILVRYDADSEPPDGWESRLHYGLLPGIMAYYSLFVRYPTGWVKMGSAEVLVPGDYGYGQKIFKRLPQWYQDADLNTTERIVTRILAAFGTEVDITRAWVETLGDVWDPSKVPARLLESLSEVMGLPYERTVGDPRVRKLLTNLVYLRKTKGTRESIEGYLSALSGYTVLTHQSLNIVLTVEDGEFRIGTGTWEGGEYSSVARQPAVGAGAPPEPQGVLEVVRTSTVGVASAFSGPDGVPTSLVVIEPGSSREFAVSLDARSLTNAMNLTFSLTFYDRAGALLSYPMTDDVAIGAEFSRVRSVWLSAPDDARYVRVGVATTDDVEVGQGIQVGRVMLVDRRWRPTFLPGYLSAEPFSSPGPDTYTGDEFYDAPRTVWLNVYPQRTNFAVNSDFTLDNLPADGWTIVDAPTYDLLPLAYTSYDDTASTESDYNDLLAEFDSITPSWTVEFDPPEKRLLMHSSQSTPFVSQVRSKAFPVLPGVAYSAGVELQSVEEGAKATLRIQWMQLENSFEALTIDDTPQISQGSTFDLFTGHYVRADIRNAVAPPGAGWGRLIVESFNNVEHTTYMQRPLIEDAPLPGPYFSGDDTDGAPGDFGYTGEDKKSFSVYYLNFNAVVGATSNRILTAAPDILPLHLNEARITTAYDGLYDELA
jgi:phage tail-like protein